MADQKKPMEIHVQAGVRDWEKFVPAKLRQAPRKPLWLGLTLPGIPAGQMRPVNITAGDDGGYLIIAAEHTSAEAGGAVDTTQQRIFATLKEPVSLKEIAQSVMLGHLAGMGEPRQWTLPIYIGPAQTAKLEITNAENTAKDVDITLHVVRILLSGPVQV